MTFDRVRHKGSRILAILLVALGMAAAVTIAAPQHAMAATCEVTQTIETGNGVVTRDVPAGLTCYNILVGHACAILGEDNSIAAIECADLYLSYTPGGYDLYGVGTYYCQGPDGYIQCHQMSVDQVMYGANGQFGHPGGNYTCSGSSCATTVAAVDTYHYSATEVITSGAQTAQMFVESSASNTITTVAGNSPYKTSEPAYTNYITVAFT